MKHNLDEIIPLPPTNKITWYPNKSDCKPKDGESVLVWGNIIAHCEGTVAVYYYIDKSGNETWIEHSRNHVHDIDNSFIELWAYLPNPYEEVK